MLLNQEHVNEEKHGGKTIEELRAELAAKTGENVVIRRFAALPVGARSRLTGRTASPAFQPRSCSSCRARR